jgi:hypothetical protein
LGRNQKEEEIARNKKQDWFRPVSKTSRRGLVLERFYLDHGKL